MYLPAMAITEGDAAVPDFTLGDRIRKARRKAGYEQDELARRVGVSRQLVSKWERNISIPDVEEAAAIAEECDVSFGWLGGVALRSKSVRGVPNLPFQQMRLRLDELPVVTDRRHLALLRAAS